MHRSTWLHLRIPFFIFLLPIFLFAVSMAPQHIWWQTFLAFFVIHFLLYPASNGYNSFFDKDEESIGGLEKPPPVSQELYRTAIFLDIMALMLGLIISWEFALMLLVYGLISKAYSHPAIRLKKYPIVGWLAAGIFQGYFTFLMSLMAISNLPLSALFDLKYQLAGAISTLFLWGSYPMTQVYQHEEDGRRGDQTLSLILGIKGTFVFTMVMFLITDIAFVLYFWKYVGLTVALAFQLFLAPVMVYFLSWFKKVLKNQDKADFHATMKLNWISSTAMNCFFLFLWYWNALEGNSVGFTH